MTQHSLIIATGNAHKVEEFELLLKGLEFEVVSAKACGGMPDVDENGSTFAANAQIKAEALRKLAPADAWVMADDSGLEVDALDGAARDLLCTLRRGGRERPRQCGEAARRVEGCAEGRSALHASAACCA